MVHPPPSVALWVNHHHSFILLVIVFILCALNNNQPSTLQQQNALPRGNLFGNIINNTTLHPPHPILATSVFSIVNCKLRQTSVDAAESPKHLSPESLKKQERTCFAVLKAHHLENNSGERQEYWLVAVKAAREVGLLWGATHQNSGCSRTALDGRFIT
jgi:hypothetical protein